VEKGRLSLCLRLFQRAMSDATADETGDACSAALATG
jgi:hypothetical protein